MSVVVVRKLQDGTERIRICWLKRDPDGPVETPKNLLTARMGPVHLDRGRIMCQPERKDILPKSMPGNEVHLVCHSDDVRACTCPECLATVEAKAELAMYGERLDTVDPAEKNVL